MASFDCDPLSTVFRALLRVEVSVFKLDFVLSFRFNLSLQLRFEDKLVFAGVGTTILDGDSISGLVVVDNIKPSDHVAVWTSEFRVVG